MSDHVYIARQPIVTIDDSVYGYELLFRTMDDDGTLHATVSHEMLATTKVMVNALNHVGIGKVVGDHLAFLNVDKELLLDDILLTIPKNRFVIELLEHIEVDEAVIERLKQLKSMGFQIALDDAHCADDFLENFCDVLPLIDILKLNVSLIDLEILQERMHEFKSLKCKLLAVKVETLEQYETYKELGCQLFQGYFFAKPDIIKKKALDPDSQKLFKLLNLLDEDSDISTISLSFEENPAVTLQLLRFMNSGALNLNSKIRSIAHAITLLGKPPLKQWLLLIAFAQSKNGDANFHSPLMELALSRSKLMSAVMKKVSIDHAKSHEAALVGILSLIEVITHTSIEVVLNEFDMDEEIVDALTKYTGVLGTILELCIAVEKGDLHKSNFLLESLKLTADDLRIALLASYK